MRSPVVSAPPAATVVATSHAAASLVRGVLVAGLVALALYLAWREHRRS